MNNHDKKPDLSPITVSLTEDYGEVVLVPPPLDIDSPEPVHTNETYADLTVRSVRIGEEDFAQQATPLLNRIYALRIVNGTNAYAIARIRSGLSVIDVGHYKGALDEMRAMAKDPIDLEESERGNTITALDLGARRVDADAPVLIIDDGRAGRIKITRDESGGYTFEVEDKEDGSISRLFYPKYLFNAQEHIPQFDRGAINAKVSFDEFIAAAERQVAPRPRAGRLIGMLLSRVQKNRNDV